MYLNIADPAEMVCDGNHISAFLRSAGNQARLAAAEGAKGFRGGSPCDGSWTRSTAKRPKTHRTRWSAASPTRRRDQGASNTALHADGRSDIERGGRGCLGFGE